ncbi:hypothetical protein HG530_001052 [Fusarium avenaceum]|nr:hypothetical protein HG530_001052 [Fusarium avenaceum]
MGGYKVWREAGFFGGLGFDTGKRRITCFYAASNSTVQKTGIAEEMKTSPPDPNLDASIVPSNISRQMSTSRGNTKQRSREALNLDEASSAYYTKVLAMLLIQNGKQIIVNGFINGFLER